VIDDEWYMTARAEIRAARAEKFTIQIRGEAAGRPRKLAKIFFSRRDGSVYLDFPYFERSDGIVAHVRLPAGLQYPRDISLVEGGKITSHLVKYAHHRDGEAHFSQTGRVVTLVRKKATPLNSYSGHLFTIQIQGLDGFDEARGPDYDYQNTKDKPLTFNVFGREPEGVKVVAFWYNERDLKKRVGGVQVGPGLTLIGADGSRHPGLLLSAVAGTSGAVSASLFGCAAGFIVRNQTPWSGSLFALASAWTSTGPIRVSSKSSWAISRRAMSSAGS
jgi:hypothetical protein